MNSPDLFGSSSRKPQTPMYSPAALDCQRSYLALQIFKHASILLWGAIGLWLLQTSLLVPGKGACIAMLAWDLCHGWHCTHANDWDELCMFSHACMRSEPMQPQPADVSVWHIICQQTSWLNH